MEPGETHRNLSMQGSADFRVLIVSPPSMADLADEDGGPDAPHFGTVQTADPDLFRRFTRFHASLERPGTTLERQSRYADCIRVLRRRCAEKTRGPGRIPEERRAVRLAKDYLRQRLAENVSLEELAAAAGLNRFPLLRAFNREVGIPPHAFQISLRIARARELLALRRQPVEVAIELGFYDQSHFSNHFKRCFGLSPREYAVQVRHS
jgi:AraC-like DNA-binding protein